MQKTLLVVCGPTAVGKTKLSIDLAKHLNTEIISTDSRQFYQEMNIGTAKPSLEELAMVPHHFINNRLVQDYYSAGDFEREALVKIEELFSSGLNQVIAVGGSGLYVKALCEGLDDMPEVDLTFRNYLIEQFQIHGITYLQNRIKELNPARFETIDRNNPQRLMRAIELAEQGGIKKTEKQERPFQIIKIGLELPREELYGRINLRVDQMMQLGLLDEVKSLMEYREINALKTVGYKEIFEYLDGEMNVERAVELIKQHTRNYAKRQMTWFKSDPGMLWFSPENTEGILKMLNETLLHKKV